jgi:hypothetical protein
LEGVHQGTRGVLRVASRRSAAVKKLRSAASFAIINIEKNEEEKTMRTAITGDAQWMVSEFQTYQALARKADQTAMDGNSEPDKVSITMLGGFHIEADFSKPSTVLSVQDGSHDYTHPLDSTSEYKKVAYYNRRTYEDRGSSLKVTWDSSNTMPSFGEDTKNASIEMFTKRTTATVNKETGKVTKQTSEEDKFIIPDYMTRNKKPYHWDG